MLFNQESNSYLQRGSCELPEDGGVAHRGQHYHQGTYKDSLTAVTSPTSNRSHLNTVSPARSHGVWCGGIVVQSLETQTLLRNCINHTGANDL